jgi:hypothetical protein
MSVARKGRLQHMCKELLSLSNWHFVINIPKFTEHQTLQPYYSNSQNGVPSLRVRILVTTRKVKFPFLHTKMILLAET